LKNAAVIANGDLMSQYVRVHMHGGFMLQDVLWMVGVVQLQEAGRWHFKEPEIM
jgi:hypothetical protein